MKLDDEKLFIESGTLMHVGSLIIIPYIQNTTTIEVHPIIGVDIPISINLSNFT